MQTFEYGGWVIEHDPQATASLYSAQAAGFAERCGCAGCRNLIAVREEAFPPDVKAFLSQFAIDYRKEADASQLGLPQDGLYRYSGIFNLVGRVSADPGDMATLNSTFKFFFVAGSVGQPVPDENRLRLEFELLAPWAILSSPESHK